MVGFDDCGSAEYDGGCGCGVGIGRLGWPPRPPRANCGLVWLVLMVVVLLNNSGCGVGLVWSLLNITTSRGAVQ